MMKENRAIIPLFVKSLASKCHQQTLVQQMEQEWLRRAADASKPEWLTAFSYALNAAEAWDGFRQFHGKLYYTYLQATGNFHSQKDVGSTGILDTASHIDTSLSKLSEERRYRILSGFWSLSQLRLKLSQPPKLEDLDPLCTGNHIHDCIPGWQTWWKDALDEGLRQGRYQSDPGKLIQEMQERVQARPLRFACASLVGGQIRLMKEKFDDTLADRFLVPRQNNDPEAAVGFPFM